MAYCLPNHQTPQYSVLCKTSQGASATVATRKIFEGPIFILGSIYVRLEGDELGDIKKKHIGVPVPGALQRFQVWLTSLGRMRSAAGGGDLLVPLQCLIAIRSTYAISDIPVEALACQ